MNQYVLQIRENDGWLAKNFEVTEDTPIPGKVPSDRIQIIMTNTTNFYEISAAYDEYNKNLIFSYSDPDISCVGAYSHTWSKD